MPASNTLDCFREFIGQRLVGVLHGALPASRRDIASGTTTMVFEDGRGLTISSKGTYWIDSAKDVSLAIVATRRKLDTTQREIEGVLELAGALDA